MRFRKSKEEKERQSVQDLIPIQAIHNGKVITTDNRIIQIIKASSLNLELMSEYEQNIIFEKYSDMLKSMQFNSQIEIVSQPMNLSKYIEGQQKMLEQTNVPIRRQLLQSSIEYVKEKERSRTIMQRKRYIIFDEKIQESTEEGYERALRKLREKEVIVLKGLKDLELEGEKVTETDINQLFQIMFDYESALNRPILTDKVENKTVGGKEKCSKQLKEVKTQTKAVSNF
ncbi:hypothetical protein [Priestia megaterium]|uniref:hypothetical protein n=1 Tax=Priestia megaterium TaxID=1404 RepID=UPI0031FCE3BF